MASLTTWAKIQERIWCCDACIGNPRVAVAIRQQTPAPVVPVQLLLLGVAPPYQDEIQGRTVANSATNDATDNLRSFVTDTLSHSWDDLLKSGVFLIHAVKCAIVPNEKGFQNPPNPVVDVCIPDHFGAEFALLRASHVVAFGRATLRAILKQPGVAVPPRVGVSKTLESILSQWPDGIPCSLGSQSFTLHVAPFPRTPSAKRQTARIMRRAAELSGILNTAG